MAKKPREILNDFMNGVEQVGKTYEEQVNTFMDFQKAAYKPGAVDVKTKELISVAIGAYNRCEFCIVYHVYNSLKVGATREEIMESAMVAVGFGGGPSMAYSVTLVKQSIDEFESDFKVK
jgi:AhpD family alkylhydroperoxidase